MATCFDISQIEETDINTFIEDMGVLADSEEVAEEEPSYIDDSVNVLIESLFADEQTDGMFTPYCIMSSCVATQHIHLLYQYKIM